VPEYAPQQADGACQNRVEHRLHIRLRLADDPQDVAGGGLGVQCRGQLAVARLEFGEQSHILDGDDGLVGEGFYDLDLGRGEGLYLASPAPDDAERYAFAQDWNAQKRSISRQAKDRVLRPKVVVGVHEDILDVHRPAVDERSAHDEAALRQPREESVPCF
jgi:hypothetical protein